MASSTFKVGDKARYVGPYEEWIGAEFVLMRRHDTALGWHARLTKVPPGLPAYRVGDGVVLSDDRFGPLGGLFDI